MFPKFVVLFAAIAFASAGYLEPGLRYAAPAIHAAPALHYAAPAISRVEHLAPAVASSYKTELYTAPSARTYEIAPAVTHVAAAPVVHHVAPAPLIARAPLVHAAPSISIAAPAISRIEHLAPAVATSYKTEVLTAPSARTYEIAPAVTHIASAPVVHHVAPAPLIARAPLVHSAPALSIAAPAFSRIEHLAPAVASSYKTELLTAPSARTYEIAPAVTHIASAPAVSFAAPAIHSASLLRAAPAHFGFSGHLTHGLEHAKFF